MKKWLFPAAFLAIALFVFTSLSDRHYYIVDQRIYLESRLSFNLERFILDNTDLAAYFKRTDWWPQRRLPYGDVLQEYPQWGLFYITLPRLLTDDYILYRTFLILLDGLVYILTLWLALKLLTRFKKEKYIWAFFLPSFLFFVFTRFDIFIVLLVFLSLDLLFRGKTNWAFLVLGFAALTKWYPILFLPLYLFYFKKNERPDHQKIFFALTFYLVPIVVPLVLTLALAGWSGLMYPYIFHLGRPVERFSALYSLPTLNNFWLTIFFYLQFSGLAFVLFLARLKSPKDLLLAMSFSLLIFIFFNRIYSAQYIIWFLPLVVFLLSGKEILVLVLYDLANYFSSISWDNYSLSLGFSLVRWVLFLVLICILVRQFSWRKLPTRLQSYG